MRVVVPLAGPDFILRGGELKANIKYDGEPLLRGVLNSRPWAKTLASRDYSFVLFDAPETRAFAADTLLDWYPDATVTFISSYTRGAALSAPCRIDNWKRCRCLQLLWIWPIFCTLAT